MDGQEDHFVMSTVNPERKKRNRWIVAGAFGSLLLLLLIAIIIVVIVRSQWPFEGFMVFPKSEDNKLIYKVNGDLSKYVQSLNSILEEYKSRPGDTAIECSGNTAPVNKDTVCRFNTSHIEAALPSEFGYQDGKPTIILQLRPPEGWQPKVYKNESTYTYNWDWWWFSDDIIPIDHVPVVCQGRAHVDHDNLGEVKVVPKKGIPLKYFPYHGQKEYQYPLVAVQFLNPVVGVMIRIKCELWDLGVAFEDKSSIRVNIYLQVDRDGTIWPGTER